MSSNLSVKILLKDGRLANARVTEDDNFEEVLFLLHIDSKQIIITIKLRLSGDKSGSRKTIATFVKNGKINMNDGNHTPILRNYLLFKI